MTTRESKTITLDKLTDLFIQDYKISKTEQDKYKIDKKVFQICYNLPEKVKYRFLEVYLFETLNWNGKHRNNKRENFIGRNIRK